MHTEIMDYLKRARIESGLSSVHGMVIVELGSYDLNGTPRPLFIGAREYVGVDWRKGPGVDLISLAHETPIDRADVVICCQVLEHDPYWQRTVAKACDMIKIGGWFFCTWAGPGYPEHELEAAPVVEPGRQHYRNLSTGDVADIVMGCLPGALISTEYKRGTLDALMWVRMTPAYRDIDR